MKKLRLDLESLSVVSFETADGAASARGTVRGLSGEGEEKRTPPGGTVVDPNETQESCDGLCGGGTYYVTCGATCEACTGNTCDYWSCDFTGGTN
jgi:hypothetical protein